MNKKIIGLLIILALTLGINGCDSKKPTGPLQDTANETTQVVKDCPLCSGAGKFACKDCNGTGNLQACACADCIDRHYAEAEQVKNCTQGRHVYNLLYRDGTTVFNHENKCINCSGTGFLPCLDCGGVKASIPEQQKSIPGTGFIKCDGCYGAGKVPENQ